MPELPEVETVVRQLKPVLENQEIKRVEFLDKKLALRTPLVGSSIRNVFRHGKYIIFELTLVKSSQSKTLKDPRHFYLVVHLRMTGRFVWEKQKTGKFLHKTSESSKHLRARIVLSRGELLFYDVRRFGTFEVMSDYKTVGGGGVEPFSREFTVQYLKEKLASAKKQPIKNWLLRQDRVVGIGNIYASEVLFLSSISPKRFGSSLKDEELDELHKHLLALLKRAIRASGTTFSDFQDTEGEAGAFQRFLKVYERAELPCLRCGAPIQRIVQAGRSTYFCSKCQK